MKNKLSLKKEDILKNNPKIDMKIVEAFNKAKEKNPKLFTSEYTIQSPFEVTIQPMFNSLRKS